jgi:hypothetical protein
VVDDQGVDEGAKINEVMPITSVAGQAGGLNAEDRANRSPTDGRTPDIKVLETWKKPEKGLIGLKIQGLWLVRRG